MLSTCLRCNWVLNAPLSGRTLHELIISTGHWLHCAGIIDAGRLQLMVWRDINGFKELIVDCVDGYQICRHCVMEIFALMINNQLIHREFENLFLKTYDFDSVFH